MPMSNPYGYHKNEREELLEKNEESFLLTTDNFAESHKDINRDFPYLVDKVNCFVTIGARVINELYLTHIFTISLSLHGGTESLTYPYGTPNHINDAKLPKVPMNYNSYNSTTLEATPLENADNIANYYKTMNSEQITGESTEAPDLQGLIGKMYTNP
jgi:hypothetical protein